MIENKYMVFLFIGIVVSNTFLAMENSEENKIIDEFNKVRNSMKKEISIALQDGYDKGYYSGLRNGRKDLLAFPQATVPQAKEVVKIDESQSFEVQNLEDEDVVKLFFEQGFEQGSRSGFLFGAGLASFIVYKLMKNS